MPPAGITKLAFGSMVSGAAIGIFLLPKAAAPQTTFHFYHGYTFGSEATYHPLSTILNGGYGILRLGIREKNPLTIDYRTRWRHVRENVTHPIQEIKAFGWKTFVTTEIFPTSLSFDFFTETLQSWYAAGSGFAKVIGR